MPATNSRVLVVAGIILRNANSDKNQQEIFIAKRLTTAHQGGLWEFPGGKIEGGETEYHALARELKEELGITLTQATHFITLNHDYSDKKVSLSFWKVTDFLGAPQSLEGQPVQWVKVADLDQYQFPKANVPVVEKLLEEVL